MKRLKSACHLQRFVSIHDPIANLLQFPVTACQQTNIAPFAPTP